MKTVCALIPAVALGLVPISSGCKDGKGGDSPSAKPKAPPTPAPAPSTEPPAPEPTAKRPGLVRAQPLPQLARASLRSRMQNHGDDTENLLWSALMLDYDSTEGIAKIISEEPTLARPTGDDLTTINAMLPPAFFDLQDQLNASIQNLQAAAKAKDDTKIASEYANVVKTCIACHSLFLQFPAPE